jgi:hypothetical protein
MAAFTNQQISQLHAAIMADFPTALGQGDFKLLLRRIDIDWDAQATTMSSFEVTLSDFLINRNRMDGGLELVLTELLNDGRPGIVAAIRQLRATPPLAHAAGLADLTDARLIIDGEPFIDRDHLANVVIPQLISPISALRAVIMTGPTDSGKTFSLKLVRRLCNAAPATARFLPIELDLKDLALTRDSEGLARYVGDALRLDDLRFPTADTGDARMARRLVQELSVARQYTDRPRPTLLIVDHLDKDVSTSVIDFVEQLALAAADGRLEQVRTLLIGFPRAPAQFPNGKMLIDSVTQPNPLQVAEYMDQVLEVLGRDIDDETLTTLIETTFANQVPPYPATFMQGLPAAVLELVDKLMKAPTV